MEEGRFIDRHGWFHALRRRASSRRMVPRSVFVRADDVGIQRETKAVQRFSARKRARGLDRDGKEEFWSSGGSIAAVMPGKIRETEKSELLVVLPAAHDLALPRRHRIQGRVRWKIHIEEDGKWVLAWVLLKRLAVEAINVCAQLVGGRHTAGLL
jgi:hypothetical protein